MKKITLLFIAILSLAFTWQSSAQHTFAPQGPISVPGPTEVPLNINDAANSAGVPTGIYTNFTISVDWTNVYNAYSSEADLTITTAAGAVVIDPPTSGGAPSGDATTLTFTGALAGDYDPSVDGTLDLILDQSWGDSDAQWDNITVTISPPPVAPDCATTPFPADGAIDVAAGTVTFTWTAPASGPVPTAYNVYAYDDAAGTNPGLVATVSTPSADLIISGYNTEIFWAAIPVNMTLEATGCDIWSFTTGDAPIGAICENSIAISTPLPYVTNDDTANYGNDYANGSSPCSSFYMSGDDVFYSFTPDSDGSFNVALTDIGASYSGIHVLDACPGSTPSCVGFVGNSGTGDRIFDVELTGGVTYYIVISTWASPNSTSYTLTLTENTCTNATATYSVVSDCDVSGGFLVDVEITDMGTATDLTISDDQGSTPQAITATGTYQFGPYDNGTDVVFTITDDNDANCVQTSSTITQAACPPDNITCATAATIACGETLNGTTVGSTGTDEDAGCSIGNNGVWYTFTGTGGDITIVSTASFDHEMAITSGACGSLTNIVCRDSSTGEESYTIPLTTLNETYYVYIARYSDGSTVTGTYSITLTCATPPACTQAVVASSTVVEDCGTSQFNVEVDITSLEDAVEISNGTDTWPVSGTGIVTVGPFDFGDSQTLVLVHNDSDCDLSLGNFNFLACPPANDDCADATILTVGADLNCTNPVSGTTIGATESLAGCVGTANDDVWYGFVATGSAHYIIINNTSGSTDIVTQVFDACGGASLVCQDTPNSPISLTGLTAGNTYYFRIYTYSSADTTRTSFDVCVGTPPPPPANDDCEGAIALTPGMVFSDNPVDGTVAFATDDTVAVGCGSDGPGVWYSVVVPADGNISIEVGPDIATGDTGFDSVIEVFSGACGSLVSIDCDDDTAATGNFSLLDLTGLTPGSTIYVRVWEYGGNDTEPFSISAYSATLSNGDIADQNTFTYFPNPVKNELNLRAQSNIQDVAIYNMLGQEVLRTAPNAITSDVDMSTLQTGTYFVKVTINDVTETIRVIKQ